ncbi:MAG: substrate-binding domain-containing protein, partial [Candidatus Bipolaricaulota bacterium]
SSTVEDPLEEELLNDGTPFVSVGRHPNEEVNFVDVDNYGGAKHATEYLLNLGHERIATITGPLDQAAGIDRLKGYKDGLRESGIEPEEELIAEGDFTEESGINGTQTLLSNFPTAIVAANDMTAIGALKALKKSGKSVPDDIAIVGFDDVASATAVEPPLTTVRQPIKELGRQAIAVLHELIHDSNPGDGSTKREFLETELVVRSST